MDRTNPPMKDRDHKEQAPLTDWSDPWPARSYGQCTPSLGVNHELSVCMCV